MDRIDLVKQLHFAHNICTYFNKTYIVIVYKKNLYFLSDIVCGRIHNENDIYADELVSVKNVNKLFNEYNSINSINRDIMSNILEITKLSDFQNEIMYNKVNIIDLIANDKNESNIFFKKMIILNFLNEKYKTDFKKQRIEANFIYNLGKINVICKPYKRTSIKASNFKFDAFINLNEKNNNLKIGSKLNISCNSFVLDEILSKGFTSNIIAIKDNFDKRIVLTGLLHSNKALWVVS